MPSTHLLPPPPPRPLSTFDSLLSRAAFPELIRDFCHHAQQGLALDPCSPILPMLAVASAAIGSSRALRLYDDRLVRPVIWSALLTSADSRTLDLLRLILNPLIAFQSHFAQASDNAAIDYLFALEEWKRLPQKNRAQKDRAQRPQSSRPDFDMFYLSTHEPSIIARILHENQAGLLLALPNLIPALPALSPAYFNVWPVSFDQRKSYPPTLFIHQPFLSVTGLIPPGEPDLIDSNDSLASFLLYQPAAPQTPNHAAGFPSKLRESWHQAIVNLRQIPRHRRDVGQPESRLSFDSAAQRLYAESHDRLHQLADSQSQAPLREHLHNLVTYIPRIALILHLLDHSSDPYDAAEQTTVPEPAVESAVSLLDYFTQELIRLHSALPVPQGDEDRDFEYLLNLIRSLGGKITPRQLMHCSRRFRASVAIAVSFLQGLVDAGFGIITWPRKNGRPSMLFQLTSVGHGNETPAGVPENGGFVTTHPPVSPQP